MNLDGLFQSFPQITTPILFLRRIQPWDVQALFGILSDHEVTRYYDDIPFTDLSQAGDQIEAWEFGYRNRRCIRWGITLKQDPALVGSCGYYGFHTRHLRAGIGYELARPFWRQGIMTEALGAILDLGFGAIGLNRIEAVVMPENKGSIKLLEKLGFCQEGILREYEHWGDKGFSDLCMLSILRSAWKQSWLSG